MSPVTVQEWFDVAQRRQDDAQAILDQAESENPNQPLGAVYMAGYSIECSLKGYLRHRGLSPPKCHDLQDLWKKSGLQRGDFKGQPNAKTFFLDRWSTSLRYESEIDLPHSVPELVRGAGMVRKYITKLATRYNRRRRST